MKAKKQKKRSRVTRSHIDHFEAHCRRVHAEAVIETFGTLFSLPGKLFNRLLNPPKPETAREGEQTVP
jgi:hypothetical protein